MNIADMPIIHEKSEDYVKRSLFEPTISWGNVLTLISMILGALAIVVSVGGEVKINARDIMHNTRAINAWQRAMKDHRTEETERMEKYRAETNSALRDMNIKVDKILQILAHDRSKDDDYSN